jgi:outer membrane receptor protein involved in Fe transport
MKSLINSGNLARVTMLFVLAAVPMLVTTTEVAAQSITTTVEGTVLRPDGTPAAGVSATITDSRDGRSHTVAADSGGNVSFRGISAGGPYVVRIAGGNYEDLVITEVYADLAGASTFNVTLEDANAAIDEITVTASQISMVTVASGPSSSFSLADITNMPSTTRQIRDVIRIDPRVSVGATGRGSDQSGAISCMGGNAKTNSFTIDGVRANDAFGLNASGNLARFAFPIPFDTVEAAAVEFAPVSVEYGQFSGCNINVVTKSGGNEFHGSGFYLFNSDSLVGDSIDGNDTNLGDFERKNWGYDVSGPIIKDKLFFYAAYEETETASINEFGPADGNFAQPQTLTTAEMERIRNILINNYGRDPGELPTNLPITSERVFVRLDWNINDDHRVEANWATLVESTTIGDDISTTRGELSFADNFHTRGSDSETFAVRIYSDWTDRLSTELRYSTQEVIDVQDPLSGGEAQSGSPIPRLVVGPRQDSGFFNNGSVFGEFGKNNTLFVSGPGVFRSANSLATTKDQFKIKADYLLGDHTITAGYEYETLDIFNLFIINATGSIWFDDIDALEAGNGYDARVGVAFTQNPIDAAAAFTRDINSVFLQDQWDVTDNLQIIYGLRYDWYTSDDAPATNPVYESVYGMTNSVSFDGLDIIQPRIGLNYTLPSDKWGDTRISAGFGVFAGNDPTVWFSNSYQNFGGALGIGSVSGIFAETTCVGDELANGGAFNGIPQCAYDGGQNQALANGGSVAATDPNFELPSVNRYSFGIEHNTNLGDGFFSDWLVKFDAIYSDMENSYDWVDLTMSQTGTAPDGRPVYAAIDPNFTGCNATFNGVRQGFSNVTDECIGANQDLLFTNRIGDEASSFSASIQASKLFEWGDGWTANVGGGYAYVDAKVGNPANQAIASGAFNSVVTDNLTNVPVGPSIWGTPHNFTFTTTIAKDFIADHTTSITAFVQVRDGHPLSLTYDSNFTDDVIGDSSGGERQLLYVPTGPTDPTVNFTMPAEDIAAFFAYTDSLGLARGAIAPKGILSEDWQSDLDIRIMQEIPFFLDSRVMLFLDIENVLNLIDDSHGSKKYIVSDGPASTAQVIETGFDPADPGRVIFSGYNPIVEAPDTLDSVYTIQFGIRGEF